MRHVRLGVLLPQVGMAQLSRIRAVCPPELGWEDAHRDTEEAAYRALWQSPSVRNPPPGRRPSCGRDRRR